MLISFSTRQRIALARADRIVRDVFLVSKQIMYGLSDWILVGLLKVLGVDLANDGMHPH